MVYISRLFLVALIIISFSSWSEDLDDKYIVCNGREAGNKPYKSSFSVSGWSFSKNEVQETATNIRKNGEEIAIFKRKKVSILLTDADFIVWDEGQIRHELNRKNLELRQMLVSDPSNRFFSYKWKCILSDQNNYMKTIETYAEIEQDAVREAWKKATEGNKI